MLADYCCTVVRETPTEEYEETKGDKMSFSRFKLYVATLKVY
jgi:hypothetical protein